MFTARETHILLGPISGINVPKRDNESSSIFALRLVDLFIAGEVQRHGLMYYVTADVTSTMCV